MTTTMISSLALWNVARISMSRTEFKIGVATQEVASGRHYDVGLALGIDTARTVDARLIIEDMDAIASMNDVATQRISTMQSSIGAMVDLARSLFAEATQAGQTGSDRALFIESARSKLAAFTSLLSATSNGIYVFSGQASLSPPVADYISDPPSIAQAGVISAFTSEFSIAPDNPAVVGITADQVRTYWNGTYSSLFETPSWQTTFSAASDAPIELRIGPQEHAAYSMSANDAGVRRLCSALVAVADSGASEMNADAYAELAGLVAERAGAAAADLTHSQASLGETQRRIANANDRMEIKRNLLDRLVGGLEGVDQVEASTRLNSLTTQLQLSYAVTARMFKLSLLDYL